MMMNHGSLSLTLLIITLLSCRIVFHHISLLSISSGAIAITLPSKSLSSSVIMKTFSTHVRTCTMPIGHTATGTTTMMMMTTALAAASASSTVKSTLEKVVVFGASGGVGQQICSKLVQSGRFTVLSQLIWWLHSLGVYCNAQSGRFAVSAVTRDVKRVNSQLFPLLSECKIVYADARKVDTLGSVLEDAKHVVISVGR